jgi:hypothetical protein
VLVLLLLWGCGGASQEKKAEAPPVAAKPVEKPVEKPPPVEAPPPEPSADDMTVGVPECDDFLIAYLRCIESKLPGALASTKDSIKQAAAAWRQAATTPEGRKALVDACVQMREQVIQATAAMGCQW